MVRERILQRRLNPCLESFSLFTQGEINAIRFLPLSLPPVCCGGHQSLLTGAQRELLIFLGKKRSTFGICQARF